MSDHTIIIGDTTFDRVDYDRDADGLYLSGGDPRPSVQTYGTPEGHAVHYTTTVASSGSRSSTRSSCSIAATST